MSLETKNNIGGPSRELERMLTELRAEDRRLEADNAAKDRALRAAKQELDADKHIRCLFCYEGKPHAPDCPAPLIEVALSPSAGEDWEVIEAELRHFHELTGMDGLEFEKTLDEATGLLDWTGTPNGAMFRALLEKGK